MPKKSRLVSLLLLATALVSAFTLSAQPVVHIIPAPRQLSFGSGVFTFGKQTTVYIQSANDTETAFAATQLINELTTETGIAASLTHNYKSAGIVLCLLPRDKTTATRLTADKTDLPATFAEEEYRLIISPACVVIAAGSEAGIFYGVQSLRQLLRADMKQASLPCLSITDKPSLPYRGWMDDISRGPIPSVEFVKKQIRVLSEFKLNFFNLYTEHVFRSQLYPDLSPTDGFTAAQLQELSAYAAQYHIQLMGNFQSFGHMGKILSNPFYASLGDNGDILNAADENTYKFLSGIYSEMIPAFNSGFFNINCDETFGLGEGRSKTLADSIGVSGIYALHINRLDKLIKPYGKRLMMWGDIAVNNQDIIEKLPRDLIILSWGYHAAESFDGAIEPFRKSGFDFMVAPGVGCWGELWPAVGNATVNISNYCRDGAKLGAMGMMNTAWDDNGHNLFEYNWHGLVWGAECAWNPASPLSGEAANRERESKLAAFNRNFDAVFFKGKGVTDFYFRIDSLRFREAKGLLGESGFWDDILNFYPSNTGSTTETANRALAAEATHMLAEAETLVKSTGRNADNIQYAVFALRRVLFAAHRNIARVHLYQVSKNPQSASVAAVKNEIAALVQELHGIKNTYIQLWERENRSWWLDKNLSDYNRMADRLLNLDKQVYIDASDEVIDGKREVKLRSLFADQSIVFTTDGTDPLAGSTKYTTPLAISSKTILKASALVNSQPYSMVQKLIFMHKAIGKLMKLNSTYSSYNPAYAAGGRMALLDGIKGSESFADGRWQGYQGQDVDIEIDMGEVTDIAAISASCMQNTYSWIVLPSAIDIYTSADGKTFTLSRSIHHEIPMDAKGQFTHSFVASFENLHTRYLKVIARSTGVLPSWHHAAGGESFIFMDEIVVE